MAVMRKKRIIYPVIAGVLASLIVAVVWFAIPGPAASPSQVATIDMPIYTSIEELTAASDTVVIGTVKGVAGRVVDYGKSDPAERFGMGVASVFYEVNVTDVLKGGTDSTIFVYTLDPEIICSESSSALRANERVLLFLGERKAENSPTIVSPCDKFYVIVSLDNGVFDVLPGGIVEPRMPEVFAKYSADGVVVEAPVFNLEEVRAEIQTGS